MILEAKEKDAEILAEMATKIWENDKISELTEEFMEIAKDENSTCFLKFIDEKAVAFANVALRHDYVEGTETSPVEYLEGVYVKENYRKKGYARELVEACEKWAIEKNCKEFASDCLLENTDSLKFHLAIGFIEANRIICFKKNLI